ncbi:MAG: extracellular solute-binding protein [Armatimonadetes bacterium]|nr:extracellular solute-binding protein [Armatimonadota bacterium]
MRLVTLLGALGLCCCLQAQSVTKIRMMAGPSMGIPPKEDTNPRSQARRAVFEDFRKKNPDIEVTNSGGLEMVGDRAEAMFLMSMAGDNAPDIFYVNFRQYYKYIEQGFCRPLDDLIAQDPESIQRANPLILKVIKSYDGRIYSIPWFQVAQGLYYRKDHFLEAGLDPSKPPKDWDEFYKYSQKLTEAHPERHAFCFSPGGPAYFWINFLWQAGGEVVVPAENGIWKAAVDSPAGVTALEFYRKQVLDTWKGADGKTYGPTAYGPSDMNDDIRTGKVSMWLAYTNDVITASINDLNPSVVGVASLPAGPAGRANEINAGMWAINSRVKDPIRLAACWRFIKYFAGDDAARINTERFVDLGMGNLVNPKWLKKFGYEDLASQVDPAYVAASNDLFQTGHPEPYGKNCQQVYKILDGALDRARLEPNTPAKLILSNISTEMDRQLLGYTPPEILKQQRSWAAAILITITLIAITLTFFSYRRAKRLRQDIVERLPAGSVRSRVYGFMAFCIFPAAATLILWSYYPLARGLTIAFQDYKVVGGSTWVGLDNFISVFSQPLFWKALMNSFIYVALTIGIGFGLPIGLALMLNEIPRGKVLFRTVYYLPAMTSPVVIALLWRQFYDKTDKGILNFLVNPFVGFYNSLTGSHATATFDWLGDPKFAMLAVVLPGVWAAAGPGSILYLAALKNVPEERYEAADLDGASWRQKIRYITLPGLKPLILINLLGVFIGGFKAMENVFLLTGGGPLYSTHTIGYEIWSKAFMYLQFGYATAAAWVMGAILVGFTLIQINNLVKMKFTAAKL